MVKLQNAEKLNKFEFEKIHEIWFMVPGSVYEEIRYKDKWEGDTLWVTPLIQFSSDIINGFNFKLKNFSFFLYLGSFRGLHITTPYIIMGRLCFSSPISIQGEYSVDTLFKTLEKDYLELSKLLLIDRKLNLNLPTWGVHSKFIAPENLIAVAKKAIKPNHFTLSQIYMEKDEKKREKILSNYEQNLEEERLLIKDWHVNLYEGELGKILADPLSVKFYPRGLHDSLHLVKKYKDLCNSEGIECKDIKLFDLTYPRAIIFVGNGSAPLFRNDPILTKRTFADGRLIIYRTRDHAEFIIHIQERMAKNWWPPRLISNVAKLSFDPLYLSPIIYMISSYQIKTYQNFFTEMVKNANMATNDLMHEYYQDFKKTKYISQCLMTVEILLKDYYRSLVNYYVESCRLESFISSLPKSFLSFPGESCVVNEALSESNKNKKNMETFNISNTQRREYLDNECHFFQNYLKSLIVKFPSKLIHNRSDKNPFNITMNYTANVLINLEIKLISSTELLYDEKLSISKDNSQITIYPLVPERHEVRINVEVTGIYSVGSASLPKPIPTIGKLDLFKKLKEAPEFGKLVKSLFFILYAIYLTISHLLQRFRRRREIQVQLRWKQILESRTLPPEPSTP